MELPTLLQLTQALKRTNQELVERYDGWNIYTSPFGLTSTKHIPPNACWHVPMLDFYNFADDDKYIVVQTGSGRHTLKPNLRSHHFIYRGQNKAFPHILSSFSRDDYRCSKGEITRQELRDCHVVNNLMVEDFMALLRTHPLFVLLDRGIRLEHDKRIIFINMNYYGLAQHYGFKSGLVDFTTDIDTAAFFACTHNHGQDIYSPIGAEGGKGVLYVHEIIPELTFKMAGFTTVGMQLYPRSGAQKGLVFNKDRTLVPLDKLVKAYPFRHDILSSQHFYNMMEGGKKLFPPDRLSEYAQQIIDSKEISGVTFAENLYGNQDNFFQNIESVERKGLSINWKKRLHFTPEMLHALYADIKNGLWEEFCKNIYFADIRRGRDLHEDLLNLPSNPNYAHFFKENEYNRIFYYESNLHKRASEIIKDPDRS